MFNAFRLMFSIKPAWVDTVSNQGLSASALVLENPKEVEQLKKSGGYQGKDAWIRVPVKVHPQSARAYPADMICQLSQVMLGMLETGMQVNVRVDRDDPSRALLVDDVNTLLSYRVQKS
jgi:hypothetical protein